MDTVGSGGERQSVCGRMEVLLLWESKLKKRPTVSGSKKESRRFASEMSSSSHRGRR